MGFIGIDRGIQSHWIYQDAEYLKVWIEILLRARYGKTPTTVMVEGSLVDIEFGQFVFGRIKWSGRLGISERRLRTLVDKMIADSMIQLVKRAPKFSVYCVTNYAKYRPSNDQQTDLEPQGIEEPDDHQNVQQTTSECPADVQQVTTKEQSNKENKETSNKEYVPFSEIITYLNEKLGTNYKASAVATKKHINARWTQGYRLDDFKTVIDKKCAEWKGNKMEMYLSPDTLFGTKFEKYLNQNVIPESAPKNSERPKEREVPMYVRPDS